MVVASGTPGFHPGQAQKAEDQNSVKNDIHHNGGRTDHRAFTDVVGDFHHAQITLGDSGQKIRPSGDPQVRHADFDQHRVMGEYTHKKTGRQFTAEEEDQ